jgi:hypothetical protein
MDHLDEHLASAAVSHKYDPAIRAAIAIGKRTLNRYYDWTDQSEVYRIAMSTFYQFPCISGKALIVFYKSYTLATRFLTSSALAGRPNGLRPRKRLFGMNLTALIVFEMTLS